jgi:lysophospholipase L1-like esterase
MSQDEIILIAGDSWAAGEWTNFVVTHGGLSEYLTDQNHKVINLGWNGGSNDGTVTRIEHFLTLNKKLNIKNIIVFQTDWMRSTISASDADAGYLNLKNRVISRFYYQLTRISTKFNVPIQVIGGCSDAIWLDQFSTEYPGVTVACQSFTNLILNNDHKISTPVYSLTGSNHVSVIENFKKQFDCVDLELLLDDIELGHQRIKLWRKHQESCWIDGVHPDRKAHKILFDFLKLEHLTHEPR